ncbi:MAG: hypothetical protein APR54_04930 [Candidatus Cloacimonas sp. SDB]|nr:MAG: hypothetical protein APR54_04930 [Candidatus Cloacimonas sp. SDB]
MTDEITPTLTLAKLYETQNELIDAVNIYFKLNKNQNSEELENKIQQLTDIIFKNINRNYNTTISQIFSKDELRYFKIIPGSNVHITNSDQDTSEIPVFNTSENNSGETDTNDIEVEKKINDQETSISYDELDAIEKKLKLQQLEEYETVTSTDETGLELEKNRLLQELEQFNSKLNDNSQSLLDDFDLKPGSAKLDIIKDVYEPEKQKSTEINQRSLNSYHLERNNSNSTHGTKENEENS